MRKQTECMPLNLQQYIKDLLCAVSGVDEFRKGNGTYDLKYVPTSVDTSRSECYSVTDTLLSISPEYGRYQREFEELNLLGEGQFGSVFEAIHKKDNSKYAVKKISPTGCFSEDLEEVHIMEKIRHPNIVDFIDAWIDYTTDDEGGDTIHIQMSLGDMTLEQWFLYPPNDLQYLISIFKQLNDAIAYLHSRNITHHDLKPSNVLVVGCETGVLVQLCDFGLACCGWKSHEPGLGTQRYAAPEQWYDGVCDPKSDMYSLGVIMFETMLRYIQPNLGQQKIVNAIADLKGAQHLPEQLSASCPKITRIIGDLVVKQPEIRTDAFELAWKFTNLATSTFQTIFSPLLILVLLFICLLIYILLQFTLFIEKLYVFTKPARKNKKLAEKTVKSRYTYSRASRSSFYICQPVRNNF